LLSSGVRNITRAERVLAAAIALARAHNAHLIGLAVIPPYVVTPAFDPTSVSMTIDTHRTAYMADVAKLKAMFNETCRREEVSCEWQQADALFGSAAACILERARSADLVVMPQDDAGWSYASLLDAAERVIIEAGRPVLLVPNNGRVALPAKRVLIAWNSRRESARATFDAIPLFSKGADVTVLWVDTASNPVMAADAPGANLCATPASMHRMATQLKQSGAKQMHVALISSSWALTGTHAFASTSLAAQRATVSPGWIAPS
jgi:nucleotide-binding universal stress UspA family protein